MGDAIERTLAAAIGVASAPYRAVPRTHPVAGFIDAT